MTHSVRLFYASTVSPQVNRVALEDILSKASTRNHSWGISGALFFNSQYFMQCLEGQAKEVNQLYRIIIADRRHEDVRLLGYTQMKARAFGDWGMGYLPATATTRPVLDEYFGEAGFDPYRLSDEDALGLFIGLRDVCLQNGVRILDARLEEVADALTLAD